MLGCSNDAAASVSRRKRSRKAVSWLGGKGVSGSGTFTATWRRGRDCCAKNTAPMPPCPMTCCSSQVPSVVPINASAFIKIHYLFSGCDVSWSLHPLGETANVGGYKDSLISPSPTPLPSLRDIHPRG